MNLKLDENLGARGAELLRAAGHDVSTVVEQQLCGTPDADLIEYCRREGRAIVTLDLGFANPLQFRPSEFPGIAVLRLPRDRAHSNLMDAIRSLIEAIRTETLTGKLWIVERNHIRVYQEREKA